MSIEHSTAQLTLQLVHSSSGGFLTRKIAARWQSIFPWEKPFRHYNKAAAIHILVGQITTDMKFDTNKYKPTATKKTKDNSDNKISLK